MEEIWGRFFWCDELFWEQSQCCLTSWILSRGPAVGSKLPHSFETSPSDWALLTLNTFRKFKGT